MPPASTERGTGWSLSVADAEQQLGSNLQQGLKSENIDALRKTYGWNQLTEAQQLPAWRKLLAHFNELVIWILIVAAVIAAIMGEWVDTSVILVIVLVNGVLGFLQEEKASRALAALRAMASPMTRVIRDGVISSVSAKELVPGDIIHLEAGDCVPADARLIETFTVSVQEASLTGESSTVNKDASLTLPENTSLGDRQNSVFMGTVLASGKATAIVIATGMQTELGRIAGMLQLSEPEPTPLQRRLSELGRILVVVCLLLVAVIFVVQYLRSGQLLETLMVAVSLAVAAVPEGLPAVVTIALALGLQRMVRRNALIRKLPSVETLGSVTVICSDKTGTLTRNEMTVREVVAGEQRYQISGAGYEPKGEFQHVATDQLDGPAVAATEQSDLHQLLKVAAHCNNASVVPTKHGDGWKVIGDPTEGALVVLAMKAGMNVEEARSGVQFEIPFDSERKAMSVVARQPNGTTVMYSKGAPEVILTKCCSEQVDGVTRPLTNDRRNEIQQASAELAARALRVLAFAYREEPTQVGGVYEESELVFAGVVGMIDPPREEVKTAVDDCREAGIRPIMITGDHPATALAIARELKIADTASLAVSGLELDALTDDQLAEQVDQIAVYARVSAAHKLRVVKAWQRRGHVVAMTGDGVNDAPAVKAADIGIAMGITGTDVTKEAADMVLTDDNFTSIVNAIREGRGIFDNIQKFVHYLLSCNAGEVMLMFVAVVVGLPLPLVAIQILWINLVTDGLPALALAMEPPERDIMQRAPRPPREPVLTWQRGLTLLYHGSLIAAAVLVGFWWVLAGDLDNTPVARSTAFAIAAYSQLAYALVCRSQRFTLPQLGLFSNPWLFAAFALSGALQLVVLTVPFAQDLFDVVPHREMPWILVAALSLAPATIIELTKIARSNFNWSMLNGGTNGQ